MGGGFSKKSKEEKNDGKAAVDKEGEQAAHEHGDGAKHALDRAGLGMPKQARRNSVGLAHKVPSALSEQGSAK